MNIEVEELKISVESLTKQLEKIIEKVNDIEFWQQCLFDDTSVERTLYDYKVIKEQYELIMD